MLVHVTRFRDVQQRVRVLCEDFVEKLYGSLAIRQFQKMELDLQSRLDKTLELHFSNVPEG